MKAEYPNKYRLMMVDIYIKARYESVSFDYYEGSSGFVSLAAGRAPSVSIADISFDELDG